MVVRVWSGLIRDGQQDLAARSQGIDDFLRLGASNQRAFSQAQLALSTFLTEDVSAERTTLFGLATGSHLKAFLHPFVCFLL